MSINSGADKESVVHIYNETLLSHKKEWNGVICREVDGPGNCYTEWNMSERVKHIFYINVYMWNLEKWYRWSYLQSRNRHRWREQTHGYQRGRRWWDGWDWHVNTTDTMYKLGT